MRIPRKPDVRVFGNSIEMRYISQRKGVSASVLHKRFLVSSEFIILYYKTLDGDFDNDLFNQLSSSEKLLFSKVILFIDKPTREFNIAVSKMMRDYHTRLKFIEAAVKAGNLSTILKHEYYEIINKLVEAGVMKRHLAAYQRRVMSNTPTNTSDTQE